MEESLFGIDNAGKSAPRWTPIQAFVFVFLAALGSWGAIGLLLFLLVG